MKVSEIDEQFIDIINYLNTNGYKPYASCDGTYASHVGEEETLTDAYIAFLESRPIMKLMAAFLRDSEFSVIILVIVVKKSHMSYMEI